MLSINPMFVFGGRCCQFDCYGFTVKMGQVALTYGGIVATRNVANYKGSDHRACATCRLLESDMT